MAQAERRLRRIYKHLIDNCAQCSGFCTIIYPTALPKKLFRRFCPFRNFVQPAQLPMDHDCVLPRLLYTLSQRLSVSSMHISAIVSELCCKVGCYGCWENSDFAPACRTIGDLLLLISPAARKPQNTNAFSSTSSATVDFTNSWNIVVEFQSILVFSIGSDTVWLSIYHWSSSHFTPALQKYVLSIMCFAILFRCSVSKNFHKIRVASFISAEFRAS